MIAYGAYLEFGFRTGNAGEHFLPLRAQQLTGLGFADFVQQGVVGFVVAHKIKDAFHIVFTAIKIQRPRHGRVLVFFPLPFFDLFPDETTQRFLAYKNGIAL